MLLCLLLCLSFVPWSHTETISAQKPADKTQPQLKPLNCEHMQRLRDDHKGRETHVPRGEKFDEFDWHLSKEVNTAQRNNIVISPISLKVVLAMLYEGALGATAHEIADALDLRNNTVEERDHTRHRFSRILDSLQTSEGEYKIKIGTHVFVDQSVEVNSTYQCKLKAYYDSDIVKVNFSNPSEAIKEINNWADKATEGKIQDLISESEASSNTKMMLLNAVYFNGQWEVPFPVNQTKLGVFHLDDKNTTMVNLMRVTDKFGYYNLPDIGAHMLELPYNGKKFSMFVLLPYNYTGLDSIVKKLGPQNSLRGKLNQMMQVNVNLVMPKFEFDFTTELRGTLEKLGIQTMFTPAAQLGDIAKTKNGLVVSQVLQKAGISVTEAGTVAYVATAIDLADKIGGSDEVVDFIVDRPFLFFIEDMTTKTTVFVGKVINPSNTKVASTPQETTGKPNGGIKPGDENRFGESGHGQFGGPNNGPPDLPDTQEAISQTRFNFFDGELLEVVSKQQGGNFVISPASVKTLVGLLYEAAAGSTLEEINNSLRLPNDTAKAHELFNSLQGVLQKMETSQVTVDSETSAFLAKELVFNKTFVKSISRWYKSAVGNVDFKTPDNAANRINSWVSTQTRGKITTLVEPSQLSDQTMAMLVNAVYFDGKWKKEFLLKNTKFDECFHSEPHLTCNKVPIMYKKELMNYKFSKEFNSHIVQIPYEDERFSMVLVVPVAVDGMRRLVRDINKLTFPLLLDNTVPTDVHLKLPRFSVDYQSDLTQALTKVGLTTVFTKDAKLPFMIDNEQARISTVVHKAKIDVTEKGTKATAVTGAEIIPLMQTEEEVVVRADRPFFFFVYEDESRSVLFSGRISSLTGESTNPQVVGNDNLRPLSGPEGSTYSHPASGDRKPINSQVAGPGGLQKPSEPEMISIGNEEQPQPHPPSHSDVQYMGGSNGQYNFKVTTTPPPSTIHTLAWEHKPDWKTAEEELERRKNQLKNKNKLQSQRISN